VCFTLRAASVMARTAMVFKVLKALLKEVELLNLLKQ
jgi:hypothetical protein